MWATGFRRSYGWLKVNVLDPHGEIEHIAGVTRVPGLCVVGMPFQSRRKSTFIDGVGADAADVARHLCGYSPCEGRRVIRGRSSRAGKHAIWICGALARPYEAVGRIFTVKAKLLGP